MKLWRIQCTVDRSDQRDWFTVYHYVLSESADKAKIMVKNMYKNSADTCLIDYVEEVSMKASLVLV